VGGLLLIGGNDLFVDAYAFVERIDLICAPFDCILTAQVQMGDVETREILNVAAHFLIFEEL
jgi:hypothetical protein